MRTDIEIAQQVPLKPITEIAQHAGYDNASKFSESFKKRYGKTPSRYRADKTNAVKRSIETKME